MVVHLDMNSYDTILYIDPMLTEGTDPRGYASRPPQGADKGLDYKYIDYNDPKLWSSSAFGKNLQSLLAGMGSGYSVQVTDFKRWVVADVTYHNFITGKHAGKTFLVVFDKPNKGNGMVMATANRYRSISGVEQAASYIKSSISSLRDSTN